VTPYETVYRPPAVFLTHNGIRVFNVYEDDDIEQGPERFAFTLDTEGEVAGAFDVRKLPGWREPEHPPFLDKPENDTPENEAAWRRFHDETEPAAIRAAIAAALDSGHLVPPPPATTAERGKPGDEPNEACPDDHNLAVWYTPSAVREHLENHEEPEPRLAEVTDADLADAASAILGNNDSLWDQFDNDCHLILDLAHEQAKKRAPAPPAGDAGAQGGAA